MNLRNFAITVIVFTLFAIIVVQNSSSLITVHSTKFISASTFNKQLQQQLKNDSLLLVKEIAHSLKHFQLVYTFTTTSSGPDTANYIMQMQNHQSLRNGHQQSFTIPFSTLDATFRALENYGYKVSRKWLFESSLIIFNGTNITVTYYINTQK